MGPTDSSATLNCLSTDGGCVEEQEGSSGNPQC